MEDKVKFSDHVILIDVAFLNETVTYAQRLLSERLGRQLPDIDLPAWLTYLTLDAGLREGNNEIQVLLIHNADTHTLNCCTPANLESLNGMACRTPLGEFSFTCVNPAGITSCEALFIDLMTLALNAGDVKRLLLLPFHARYGNSVAEELNKISQEDQRKECDKALYFSLEQPERPLPVCRDSVVFSLVRAWGINPDEMK